MSSINARLLREAVKEPGAAGGHEIRLAAAAAGVGGVPRVRAVAAPLFIVVPHSGAACAVARPVAASVIASQGSPVGTRTGQHVMRVRAVAAAFNSSSFFGK